MLPRLLALFVAVFSLAAQSYTPGQLPLATNAVAVDRIVLWQGGVLKQVPSTTVGPTNGTTGRAVLASETAATARTALGLVIGTDVQAYDIDLNAIAALSTVSFGRSLLTSNSLPYQLSSSELSAIAALSTSSFGRSLLTSNSLGYLQPLNADLTAISSSGTGTAGRAVLGLVTTNSIVSYIGAQPVNGDLSAIASGGTGAAGRAVLALATTNGILSYLGAQPVNGDLSAISSGGTGAAGRAVLAQVTTNGILSYISGQPLDSDLTSIAALATTSVGRSLLAIADAAAGRTILSAQQSNGELTAIAALSTGAFGRSLLTSNSFSGIALTNAVLTGADITVGSGTSGTRIGRIRHGRATLVAGTATVTDAYVTTSTRIPLSVYTSGGTRGYLDTGTRSAGTSFTITSSSGSDTSVVDWVAFEP